MHLRHGLCLAFALACGGQRAGVTLPGPQAHGGTELRVGDYVVYRFTGKFTKTPVVLREEVVSKDAGRVTLAVRATRGTEERKWTQVGPDGKDARWENTVDEIYVAREGGAPQRLPNPDNRTLARLYEWVLVDVRGDATEQTSAPCEQTIASARYACTCERALHAAPHESIRTDESRCADFPWQRGPARWTSGDAVVWQVEVIETSAVR